MAETGSLCYHSDSVTNVTRLSNGFCGFWRWRWQSVSSSVLHQGAV